MPGPAAVPFRVRRKGDNDYTSITIQGVARLERDAFVLEFVETTRGVAGGNVTRRTGDVTVVRVPVADIESVDLRRRFLRAPTLHVRVGRLGLLDRLAGVGRSACVLDVHRRDTTAARDLVASVSLATAEHALRTAENGQS